MQNILNNANNKRVAFIEDIKHLNSIEDLASKKLCIIKTNFKNLSPLKKYINKYPNTEFWLTSKDISRQNIIQANSYGVKNVLPYPFDMKIVRDYLKKKYPQYYNDKFTTENASWLKGLKIMIVDDNPMNIDLLAESIYSSEIEISTFIDERNALNALEKEKFDLFLLDIMMPNISGFELAKKIKKSKLNKDTPIIFITALSDIKNKIEGYNLGSCAYIEKPFNVNVFRSQVFNILKSKKLQEAIIQTKENFIAMVAHDLKSPVYAEITALELLLEKINTDDKGNSEILNDLLQAAKYMKNLVDNILHKYKFETNNVSLNKNSCSLKILITDSISEIKYLAEDREQNIIFKNSSKQNVIQIDYIEIKRVIHNLLSNAINNSPKKSNITIKLSENKNDMTVSIENISKNPLPENIDDLFDKFVSIANQSKCINLGLGLYVAKRIIEAHNGTIHGELTANNKVRFIFTLPKKIIE